MYTVSDQNVKFLNLTSTFTYKYYVQKKPLTISPNFNRRFFLTFSFGGSPVINDDQR
jgi:hypothetical protein